MDLLLLLLIAAVFILPSFFMMRTQRRRQAELQSMQAALNAGDRVVTVAGIHGTIVGARDTELDIEIAPGTVVVMDRIAVLRPQGGAASAAGYDSTYDASSRTPGLQHPENTQHPAEPEPRDFPEHPENRPTDGGHPENR